MRWTIALIGALAAASGCNGDNSDSGDMTPGWHFRPRASDAAPFTATKMLQGTYPVGSHLKDKKAPGGYGPCDKFPFDIGANNWGTKGAVSLVVFDDEPVAYFKGQGIAVRLINRTGGVAAFRACDSCLPLVREAQDASGKWRPIEFAITPICGNSFHRVFLKRDQYWQFPARVYTGPVKTKMRFRLDPGEDPPLYSNEISGAIAAEQFQELTPRNEPVE